MAPPADVLYLIFALGLLVRRVDCPPAAFGTHARIAVIAVTLAYGQSSGHPSGPSAKIWLGIVGSGRGAGSRAMVLRAWCRVAVARSLSPRPGLTSTPQRNRRQRAVFVDGDLVGAIGDDEQTAMSARYLGDLLGVALPGAAIAAGRVLNAGVGTGVQQALHLGAASVTVNKR